MDLNILGQPSVNKKVSRVVILRGRGRSKSPGRGNLDSRSPSRGDAESYSPGRLFLRDRAENYYLNEFTEDTTDQSHNKTSQEDYFDEIFSDLPIATLPGESVVPERDYKRLTFSVNAEEQSHDSVPPQLQTQGEVDQQGPPKGPGTSSNSTPSGDFGPETGIQANLAQNNGTTGETPASLENLRVSLPRSRAGDEDAASRAESAAQRAENAARRAENAAQKAQISAEKSRDATNYSAHVLGKTQQQLNEVTALLSATEDLQKEQLEEVTALLLATQTLQKLQIDQFDTTGKQIQKKLLEIEKDQTISNIFKKEVNLFVRKLGFVSHDRDGNVRTGYQYTLADFNQSVKDSQRGLGRYLIRLNVKEYSQPETETSTRTALGSETVRYLVNQPALEVEESRLPRSVEHTPDPDQGRPAFKGPWERELWLSYSPPTFFPNQINISRNRLSSDWAFTVEKYKNKPWFFGIVWTTEGLVAPNHYSPSVDERDGLTTQQRLTARFGDNYSVSTVWWKRDDKTFTRIQFGSLWNNVFEVPGFESRLEAGVGFMSPQGPIRTIPSLLNLENLKKGFFVHGGAEINTYFLVMVKRFSGRIILGLPQTIFNNQGSGDKTDLSQDKSVISKKVDQVIDILKQNTKNHQKNQKTLESLTNSQLNMSRSEQFKNQPSVNDEKEAEVDNNEKEAEICNNEKKLVISNNEKELVIQNTTDLLKQVEKRSSPKELQKTLVEDNSEFAKQATKQIETNLMVNVTVTVTDNKQLLGEDFSKNVATVSQLNELKQVTASQLNEIKVGTASQLNEIKKSLLQNKIEVLDQLKRVGPEILDKIKIIGYDLTSSTDGKKTSIF